MPNKFDRITIIYNPNSTGNAPALAKGLYRDFSKRHIAHEILLTPTEYAGHAEQVATQACKASPRPLVVSVSGDGGYHEVINGVLKSGNTEAVCAVEGAGNANDHWRVVHKATPLGERITNKPRAISLLKIELKHGNNKTVRYAHSYIGFGVSAQVAQQLNKYELNALNEKRLLIKELFNIKTVIVLHNGTRKRLDSILAANINEMAKQLKIDSKLRTKSPQFRFIMNAHRGPFPLIGRMIHATIQPDNKGKLVTAESFQLCKNAWLQCDGEPMKVRKGTEVTISGIANALKTI